MTLTNMWTASSDQTEEEVTERTFAAFGNVFFQFPKYCFWQENEKEM